MPRVIPHDFGWQPDLADHRDYGLQHEAVVSLLQKLKMRTRPTSEVPESVDWREYCGPVEDQQGLGTSAAHACVALIQHFERRSTGRLLRLSRLFAHAGARRLLGQTGTAGVSLRAVFKAVARCGIPPEKYWPYDSSRLDSEPDPFTYNFKNQVRGLCYARLDGQDLAGEDVLDRLRSCLASGYPFAFGFPVSTAIRDDAEISFPTSADGVQGGLAVIAVGYNDKLRIRSDKGALLIRNCWGADWGDAGYGWLPYAYVRERLAVDCWTLLKPSWLRSGEFEMPS